MTDKILIGDLPEILSSNKNFWSSNNDTRTVTIGDRISTIAGSTIIIQCPFKGKPYPRASWFYNNKIVDHVKFANIDITEPNGVSLLTIHSLDRLHVGRYTCLVFNVYGRRSSTAFVRQIGM